MTAKTGVKNGIALNAIAPTVPKTIKNPGKVAGLTWLFLEKAFRGLA
jgi:hypothetical protein